MNSTALYPFYDAVFHLYMYENAVFDVFLTGKPFFRRTDPDSGIRSHRFFSIPRSLSDSNSVAWVPA